MLQINTLARLDLGVKDENKARDLYIDMNAWYTDYPNGSFSIWHKRNGDQTKYAVGGTSFDRETGILTWTPTAYDTFYVGKGLAEIRITENDVVKKTKDVVTEVARSLMLGSGETLESGWQNLVNTIESMKNAAEQAAEEAVHNPTKDAEAWAVGTRDGVPVESTDPTYHNNSLYWKEQAADSATSAGGSASTAGTKAQDSESWADGKRGGVDVGSTDPAYHNNAKYYAGEAKTAKTEAEAAQAAAEAAMAHYPYVDTVSGNWMVWDTDSGAFVNTGIHAQGPTGTVPNLRVGTVTTLQPNQSATVERRSGSPDTEPVFDFGIPKGETGSVDNVYGNTIEMSSSDTTKVSEEIAKKAKKVSNPTNGNLAGLDSNGDLTDSGKAPTDFVETAKIYNGMDKTSSGYVLDARQGPAISTLYGQAVKANAYQATLQSGEYKLPSGTNAKAGDFIMRNGIMGRATNTITGGSTVITEGTNWERVTEGTSNRLNDELSLLINDCFILINGDKAGVNVTAGQFVKVVDSTITGVTDGAYIAAASVSSGVSFTSNDLTAISNGVLNELYSQIDSLRTRESVSDFITWGSSYAAGSDPEATMYKCGRMRILSIKFLPTSAAADQWTTIGTIKSGNRPPVYVNTVAIGNVGESIRQIRMTTAGVIEMYSRTAVSYRATFVYMV